MRLAILASGSGTNAQAIIEAVQAGRLDADVRVVLTNRPGAGVIARAQAACIPVEIVPSKGIADREAYDRSVLEVLSRYDVEAVALAGWMRILSEPFVKAYEGRMVNLHPAILPSFTGATGIADACAHGVKITGCTVHLVSAELDAGPIVIQAAVPVQGGLEGTEERIHRLEHLILPQALQWMAEGRIAVEGRTVVLAPAAREVTLTSFVDGCLVSPPLENHIPQK